MSYTILYPPTIDFDWQVQRPQQLMRAFASLGAKVFYMNPGTNTPHTRGAVRVSNNLVILNKVDPRAYIKQRPIFYFSSPAHVDLIPRYNPSLVVFDYLDEPVEEFVSLAPYLRRALTSADLVVASSERLYRDSLTVNPNTILVPNGCDFDHFNRAQHRNLAIPDDMKDLKPPIVGYHGAIATWLNFDLILRVADSLPHGHVVMVGPLYNLTSVPRRPNLHWLGYKRFEVLPQYTQLFDVAIIPFRVSQLTEAVNPIKMWEYMAAGIPVVTTALPETQGFPEIYYSANDDEFIINVRRALNEDPAHLRQARIELAQRNTWLERARQILQAIERTMELVQRPGHARISGFRHEIPLLRRKRRIVIRVGSGVYGMTLQKDGVRRAGIPPVYGSYIVRIKKPLVIPVGASAN
ncbi:MAG: glycosyltransferase family 1 protein [Syntrophomonadaceae bacterium]|nr:glycosyltransferase family 1 protein [Syntrophomonadaceae bacterium]